MSQDSNKLVPTSGEHSPLKPSHLRLIQLLATGDTGRSAHRIVKESGILSYSTYKRIKGREDFKAELGRQIEQHGVHDRAQAWRSRRRNLLKGDERAIKDTLDRTEGPPAQEHKVSGGIMIPIIVTNLEDITKPPVREDLIKKLRDDGRAELQS